MPERPDNGRREKAVYGVEKVHCLCGAFDSEEQSERRTARTAGGNVIESVFIPKKKRKVQA